MQAVWFIAECKFVKSGLQFQEKFSIRFSKKRIIVYLAQEMSIGPIIVSGIRGQRKRIIKGSHGKGSIKGGYVVYCRYKVSSKGSGFVYFFAGK